MWTVVFLAVGGAGANGVGAGAASQRVSGSAAKRQRAVRDADMAEQLIDSIPFSLDDHDHSSGGDGEPSVSQALSPRQRPDKEGASPLLAQALVIPCP